jgi:hypothetical protein
MLIRREVPSDAAAIHTVTSAAFARADQPRTHPKRHWSTSCGRVRRGCPRCHWSPSTRTASLSGTCWPLVAGQIRSTTAGSVSSSASTTTSLHPGRVATALPGTPAHRIRPAVARSLHLPRAVQSGVISDFGTVVVRPVRTSSEYLCGVPPQYIIRVARAGERENNSRIIFGISSQSGSSGGVGTDPDAAVD